MKNFKRIAISFLALIIALSATTTVFAVMVYNENGYLYTFINNELVSLYGVEEELTDIVVPSLLNTRKVVDISNNAFYDNEYPYIYREETTPSDEHFEERKREASSIISFIRKSDRSDNALSLF